MMQWLEKLWQHLADAIIDVDWADVFYDEDVDDDE